MPWLFKSEPDVFSFTDLKARKREPWSGVRNYMARNYMRDDMEVGDLAFFYHSSCPEPGIAGIMKIASKPYADPTQFEPGGEYEDPKATPENPRWQLVDVAWAQDFKQFVSLEMLRQEPGLSEMKILQKGNRLSITPVSDEEFKIIRKLGGLK
jgi:predicted RNA-binding protein with PUA-like domain